MKKSKPLKIAVLGVGGIGSCFAFQLARVGGHDVTTIARPGSKRLEELKRDDGIVDVQGERAQVSVAQELDHQIEYDLIIVTLKAYQLPPVLTSLQKSAAKCILFMINIFEPELLRDQLGATRCFFGIPFVQASIDGSGRLRCKLV
jgi:2-dehydropantoate 2-reductase